MGNAVCRAEKMLVIVSGLMRSGTSPLSMFLHELGVPMGTQMRFPVSPKAHLEWEDTVFTDAMYSSLLKNTDPSEFMREYIGSRERGTWGVKSPFLLPFVSTFISIAAEFDEEVKFILTKRSYSDTLVSLNTQFGYFEDESLTKHAKEIQQKLLMHWDIASKKADLIVDIEETWNSPERVKEKLLELIRG